MPVRCDYNGNVSCSFRLRRHSNSKHPNLPIKWVDVETGQVSQGSLKPSAATNRFRPHKDHDRPRSTARKSTSKAARLRFANFTASHQSADECEESSGLDSDLTIVDETPFVIGEPYSLVTNKSESEIDFSVDLDLEPRCGVISLCCHLCLFTTLDRVDFVSHLADHHTNAASDSVNIEILPGVEDHDAFALRRCGFCRYETYAGHEFNTHVLTHTNEAPTQCSHCSFASFRRKTVEDHIESEHPGLEVQLRPLKDQYTMSNDSSTHQFNGLDVIVMLHDLMELSDLEFQSVISAHRVSFDRRLL